MSVQSTERTRHDLSGTTSQQLMLRGDLDLAGAAQLEAILRDAIARGCRDIHLDLAAVSFLDTAGLSVLVAARSQLSALGGRLVLQEPSWSVRRLVCLADLCPLLGLDTGGNRCRHSDAAGSRYPAAEPIEKDAPLRVARGHVWLHPDPVHAA